MRAKLPGMSDTNIGAGYDDDQVEFIKAVERWRVKNRRVPTCTEVLAIAKSLGYRRPTPRPRVESSSQLQFEFA